MGLRNIIKKGDPSLLKKSREVTNFDKRLAALLDDMRETLIAANGLGLAGPQVGVLRRVCLVIDTSGEEEEIVELVNPVIVEAEGEQDGMEGCLSLPGVWGMVKRPMRVKVAAQDRDGNWFEREGEGLTARAFCHEIDHLSGVLFDSVAERILDPEEVEKMAEQEEAEENGEAE
ncbi:MAG: peptide deformylase [Oscillospiraceae bacterium]|nr:peptide deformylase [Oscillospiraceae bacterium]